jgi:hypothetical protein
MDSQISFSGKGRAPPIVRPIGLQWATNEVGRLPAVIGAATQSPWYAVVAGLGAAIIVATTSYLAARQQRRADVQRLQQQLLHDREQRAIDHLRITLHPIVARAVNSDAIGGIVPALSKCRTEKPIQGWPSDALAEVRRHADLLERDRLALIVLLGPDSPIVASLKALCDEILAIEENVTTWLNGRLDFQAVDSKLRAAISVHGSAVERFVHEAHMTAGEHATQSPASMGRRARYA